MDPGVGTQRSGLVVESGGQIFVGPDNGLLMPAAGSLGAPRAFRIDIKMEAAPSNTFHGRDIFAPAAAMLASGKKPESFGERIRPVDMGFGAAKKTDQGIEAAIIYVDKFGNLVLNIRKLPSGPVSLKGIRLRQVRTYAEVKRIEPLITIGSHGFAEVAVNQGSAAEAFGLRAGDRIVLEESNCSE